MTKLKRALIVGATILALGATSITSFAAVKPDAPEPNAVVCTAENKAERLQEKKDILAEKVKDGKLTQAQADEITAALEANQANCDGTGSAKIGQKFGAGFGHGNGQGHGRGHGRGPGNGARDGSGLGQGNRLGNGQGKCQGQCNGNNNGG